MYDKTIFDDFQIPKEIDKQTLIDNLILELAELEIIYPNNNVLRSAIGSWSAMMVPIWEKLFETTQYDYNPIFNTDRTELHVETENRNLTKTYEHEETTSSGGQATTQGTTNSEDNNVEKQSVTGFNSGDLVEQGQTETNAGNETTSQTSTNSTSTGTRKYSDSDTDTGNVTHTTEIKSEGNIGVTTTQEMIIQEREVVKFNIMHYIIEEFKIRFCICVW